MSAAPLSSTRTPKATTASCCANNCIFVGHRMAAIEDTFAGFPGRKSSCVATAAHLGLCSSCSSRTFRTLSAKYFSFATLSCRVPEREGLAWGKQYQVVSVYHGEQAKNPRGVDRAKGQYSWTPLPSSTEEWDFQSKQLQKDQSIPLVFSYGRLNEWLPVG